MTRKIKQFTGKGKVLPMTEECQIIKFMDYLKLQMEKAETDIKRYQAHRNYIFCLIGFNTALRCEDICQLRVTDVVNNGKAYISIKEFKTGKFQNFPIDKRIERKILEYINVYQLDPKGYLFMGQYTTLNGKEYNNPITRQTIYRVIKKAAKETGITFPFGVHSLRKTFGQMYIKKGGNPTTLMKMYNHSSFNVTERYIEWGIDEIQKEHSSICIGL